jgi:hypothetical protein
MIEKRIENFTQSQKIGLEKLKKFIDSPKSNKLEDRVFVLMGKAGTGKTTIIKYALDKYLQEDIANITDGEEVGMFATPNVIGVTMSHKAKQVLSHSIYVVRTFASYFGLKQSYNEDGSIKFKKDEFMSRNAHCYNAIKFVVHDECSMYDQEMKRMVEEETNSYSKIIFMGDPGQLPPIKSNGDSDSPIFTSYKHSHTLEERVRQTEGNPIVELSDIVYEQIFRSNIEPNNDDRLEIVMNAFRDEKIIDGKGFKTIFYNDFLKQYKASSEDFLDSKVVAYRNDKVNLFNSIIRKDIHNNPTRTYIEGEIIYMNNSYMNKVKGSIANKWVCFNSDEYKILAIKEDVIDEVDVYLVYVDKKGHKQLASVEHPYIPVVSEKGQKKFNEISYWRKKKALESYGGKAKVAWKYYYDFINQFGDVSYGYCYTGYKAQGSGFKNIFIDVNDIITVGPISTKRKLQALYTAITRASHLVTFLKAR